MGQVNRLYPDLDDAARARHSAFAHEIAQQDPAPLRQAKYAVNITMDIMGQHYVDQPDGRAARPDAADEHAPSAHDVSVEATGFLHVADPKPQWALRVSNPRPPPCKSGALPAELNARTARHGSGRGMDPVDRGGPGLAGAPGGGVPRPSSPRPANAVIGGRLSSSSDALRRSFST